MTLAKGGVSIFWDGRMQAHTSGGSHVPCALANRKIPNTRRGAVAAHAPGAPTLGRPPAPLAALAAPLQRQPPWH